MRLGDSLDTSFWVYHWVSHIPLKQRFKRLYHIHHNKCRTIGEVIVVEWGKLRWIFQLRRSFFDMDLELVERVF